VAQASSVACSTNVTSGTLPAILPLAYAVESGGNTFVFYFLHRNLHYFVNEPNGSTENGSASVEGAEPCETGTRIATGLQPNGEPVVYYVAKDRQIYVFEDVGGNGSANSIIGHGEKSATGTDLSVIQDGDATTLFYVGADDQIWTWSYDGSWTNAELVGDAAVPGDGMAADLQANGYQQIFYVGTDAGSTTASTTRASG
jgi:hypothetical protein